MSWYEKSKLKRPYKAYIKFPGGIRPLGTFDVVQSNEKTEERTAMARAYKEYPNRIYDAEKMGGSLVIALDVKEWQNRLEIQRREEEKEYWWDRY